MSEWDWLPMACAAVLCAFYLYNVPMTYAFAVRIGGWGLGVGAFSGKGALKRAHRRANSDKPHKASGRSMLSGADSLLKWARFLVRHGRVDYIFINGVVALSDAMLTALAYGALTAIGSAAGERARVYLWPDFTSGYTNVEFAGIASLKLGHSIWAACYLAAMIFSERRANNGQASD